MKQFFLLLLIFVLFFIPALAQRGIVLNQKQAVSIAEKFVSENGYTDNSPMGLISFVGNRKRNLNLIQRQAVVAFIKKVGGQSIWSIQFLLTEQDYKNQERTEQRGTMEVVITYDFGREVRMSLNGKKVWMERKPIAVQEANLFGDCTGESEKAQSPEKP